MVSAYEKNHLPQVQKVKWQIQSYLENLDNYYYLTNNLHGTMENWHLQWPFNYILWDKAGWHRQSRNTMQSIHAEITTAAGSSVQKKSK